MQEIVKPGINIALIMNGLLMEGSTFSFDTKSGKA
jgi:hypothetical protein